MTAFEQIYGLYIEELYSNCHSLALFFFTNPSMFGITHEMMFAVRIINAHR